MTTVFILGAGASMPYGFPSGAQLTTEICNTIINPAITQFRELLVNLGHQETEVMQFAENLRDSQLFSIDAFLARHPDRSQIGRQAIACQLIRHERYPVTVVPGEGDWYRHFWNEVVGDAGCLDDVLNTCAPYRFFTFNYDRSFEMFLTLAASKTFGLPLATAFTQIGPLFPVHLYGQLGKLGDRFTVVPANGERAYDTRLENEPVSIAAEGIRVIPEHRDQDDDGKPTFPALKAALRDCAKVIFLGFGFDPINCRRIDLPRVLGERDAMKVSRPQLIATMRSMRNAAIQGALQRTDKSLHGVGSDCLTLMLDRNDILDIT